MCHRERSSPGLRIITAPRSFKDWRANVGRARLQSCRKDKANHLSFRVGLQPTRHLLFSHNTNGSGCPEPSKSRGATHSVQYQYSRLAWAMSSYLERLSLCSLPKMKLILHRRKNGPGGIRTRICDLDRVLCSRYTTGPESSVQKAWPDRKRVGHYFIPDVPKREQTFPTKKQRALGTLSCFPEA